jgi:hypothetical protein
MVRTDLPIIGRFKGVFWMLMVTCLFSQITVYSNVNIDGVLGALACNDNVQVSLNGDCEAVISPDIILEGEESIDIDNDGVPDYDPANYTVTVNGVTGPTVTIDELGVFQVTITELPTGNSCWGFITVEDKLPPVLDCACPEGGVEVTSFEGTFTDAAGPSITTCSDLQAVIASPTLFYESHHFTVSSVASFNINFGSHTLGCEFAAVVYAGKFDPNNPCSGIVATGNTTVGAVISGLLPGVYELVIFTDSSISCSYTVNSSDELAMYDDECMYLCSDVDGILDGTIATPDPMVSEFCTPFSSDFNDSVEDFGCSTKKVKRTWSFTDGSGNTSTCTQEFILKPIGLGDVKMPEELITLPCENDYEPEDIFAFFRSQGSTVAEANMQAYPTIDGVPLSGAVCGLALTKEDTKIPLCPGEYKVVRKWIIVDWCTADIVEFTQIIKLVDDNLFTICPEDGLEFTVNGYSCMGTAILPPPITGPSCSALSYSVGFLLADDNGNPPVNGIYESTGVVYPITSDAVVPNLPKGRTWVRYTVYDECGRTADCFTEIDMVDHTPPVAIAKQFIVVSLTGSHSDGEAGMAKIFTNSVDNESYDSCTDVYLEIRRESDNCGVLGNTTYNNDGHPDDRNNDPDGGQFVKFCCNDLDQIGDNGVPYGMVKVWLRVWDDADMDGFFGSDGDNYNETWAEVRVEDKLDPWLICPPDVVLDCHDDIYDLSLTGMADVGSNCDNREVDYIDDNRLNQCGVGFIFRKWFVVGRPDIFCTQEIEVESTDLFDGNINWPQDQDVDCTDLGFVEPTWPNDLCALVGYSLDSDTFFIEAGGCFKILNHFTVIDWCLYDSDDPLDPQFPGVWTYTQEIKVTDNDAPTVMCEVAMYEADDYSDADNDGIECENRNVILTAIGQDLGDCMSDWLKWKVEIDFNGDGTIENGDIYSSYLPASSPNYIEPTSSMEEVQVTLRNDVEGSMANHIVKWTVTDGCGNFGSCDATFMVVDKKPPTPYCINLSTALMENGQIELWACDFDLGSFDNCSSELKFTFNNDFDSPEDDPDYNSNTRCSAKVFDCDDLPEVAGEAIPLEVYVWDDKDNYDFCTVMLTLVDNNDACDGGPQSKATIAGQVFTESGQAIKNVEITNTSSLPEYPIVGITNDNGMYAFHDNPMYIDYQVDADKNDEYLNGVSTLDLVLIQRHILGLQDLTSPYRMIAADVNSDEKVSAIDLVELRKLILGLYDELPLNKSWRFVDAFQVLNDSSPWPFTETREISPLNQNRIDEDWIGVKIGDVNESATINFTTPDVEERSNESLELVVEYIDPQTVAITAGENFEQIYGYQFSMSTGASLSTVKAGALDLTENHFGLSSDRQLTTSYHNAEGKTISEGTVLFTLVFDDLAKLNILENTLEAQAYKGEALEVMSVTLRNADQAFEYSLAQNQPNPFGNKTVINFSLAKAGVAKLAVYDLNGKVVRVKEAFYEKGPQAIMLTKEELNSNGVLYYQLESGNYTATKKMIIIQ